MLAAVDCAVSSCDASPGSRPSEENLAKSLISASLVACWEDAAPGGFEEKPESEKFLYSLPRGSSVPWPDMSKSNALFICEAGDW